MAANHDKQIAQKGQMAALVIAGSMLFWLFAQWAGPKLGLPGKYAVLIDFAVMAAMIWALVVTYQMWRARRNKG